jgi:LPXTG-site transpeptidase (sortase) family protein
MRPLLPLVVVVLVAACGGGTATTSPRPSASATLAAGSSQQPRPPGVEGKIPVRMVIPKIAVSAAVEVKGLDPDRKMQVPDDPHNVAWYYFTAVPGSAGNAVFAGHKDWYGIGPAVFYHLDQLQPGDEVQVETQNGSVVRYRVTSEKAYDANAAPMAEIIGRTEQPSITMYTCAGDFDSGRGEYTHRFVVRAQKA